MPAQKKHDLETQVRAVRMFPDRMVEGDVSQLGARKEVGELLGFKEATLRNWIRRDLGEGSTPPAAGEDGSDELVQLRKENARLRRANEDRMAAEKSRRLPPFSGVLVLVASRSLRLVDLFSHTRWVAGHYAI